MGDVELKATTHYRDRVATFGSAAYGNGRADNRNEKKREIRKLDYENHLFKAKKIPIIKQAKINVCMKKMLLELNKKREITHIEVWKEEILNNTPRYIYEMYDAKNDKVIVKYLGELQNIMKYYSETSVIEMRKEVEESIEKIREKGILSDTPFIIEISRSQYQDFVRYELKDLKSKIETRMNEKEQKEEKIKTGAPK